MSPDPTDRQIDEQLRAVEVPSTLVARLQSIAFGQEQIDRKLCQVPLPGGFLERLRRIAEQPSNEQPSNEQPSNEQPSNEQPSNEQPSNEQTSNEQTSNEQTSNEQTSNEQPESPVEGPPTPFARRRLPIAESLDLPEEKPTPTAASLGASAKVLVDEWIGDIPFPPGLAVSLRRIPAVQFRRGRRFQALALFVLVFLGFHALLAVVTRAVMEDTQQQELVVDGWRSPSWSVEAGPLRITQVALDDPRPQPSLAEQTVLPVKGGTLSMPRPDPVWSPVVQRTRDQIRGRDLTEDMFIGRYGVTGAPQYEDDRVPDLRFPTVVPARGFDLPLVPHYDREFLLRTGIRPPVSPSAHVNLRTVTVPLSPTTRSFDEARLALAEGRWPLPRNVRVEDFLAAMRVPFAEPSGGELALRLAGGPAPFGRNRSQLLQVAVQAGEASRGHSQATHLVVALDISNSMRWSRKLELAQDGLRRLLQHLKDGDRVTLVVFNERVSMAFDRGGSGNLEMMEEAVDSLVAGGGTDVCGALQLALKHALSVHTSQRRTAVALLTDDRSRLPADSVAEVGRLLSRARQRDIPCRIIDLDHGDDESASLNSWALVAGRRVWRLMRPDDVRWALVNTLLGDAVIARRVAVRVRFNPEVVVAYRLLGHDISRVESPVEVQADAVLHSKESAMCLFEVWLRARSDGRIAKVQLTASGVGNRSIRQESSIYMRQLAPSAESLPASLQAAAVAAETAEVLRRGYLFDEVSAMGFRSQRRQRQVDYILKWAAARDSNVRSQPGFRQFLEYIEGLPRVRR